MAALLSVLLTSGAHAQTAPAGPVPSLDLRNFHPPIAPFGALYVEPSETPGAWEWNVGAWASHAYRPILLEGDSGTAAYVVEHQTSVDYFANVGLGERLAVGFTVPTVLYQNGDDVSTLLPGATQLPNTALGDVSIMAKAALISPSELGGFGLAMLGRVYAPTGNPRSYVSDGAVRGQLRALGELQLLALAIRATAGAAIRASEQTLIEGAEDFTFGHDLPWGIGLTFRPQVLGIDSRGRWRWTVEARGAIGLTPEFAAGPQSPALAGLSASYTVEEVSMTFGVELPLNDAVGNPIVRPVLGIGWAPRFKDADGDLISDADDECPELAEDRDGFEDEDGCPDFDNDDDGVSDEEDRCPDELEDLDDFEDQDGCPDPDNDGDTVLDTADACPDQAGPSTGARPGCPDTDEDGDGILSSADRCPNEPEDLDGHLDDDGCPDPDNDGDSILDAADRCPLVPGVARPSTPWHGCPNPDRDGDTFDDDADQCPDEPEDFNGVDDADGCADAETTLPTGQPGQPLVVVEERAGEPTLLMRQPLRFAGVDVDPRSMSLVRALAQVLNQHPSWVLAVGVRPNSPAPAAEQEALDRSFSLASALRALTHRNSAAESVSFSAVENQQNAQKAGVGLLILVPEAETDNAATQDPP